MPAISALSGNLGLQASSNTIRGLGTGHISKDQYCSNILKEIKSGLITSSLVSFTLSTIATVWSYNDKDNTKILNSFVKIQFILCFLDIFSSDPEHPFVFGGVIFLGTWISMMVSTVNGAGTPVLARLLRLDPAKIAGPLETAFQDIVGQSFLLGVSYAIFSATEHRM